MTSTQVFETSVNNSFLRTNFTRTISKSYELFLGLNNTTCCLFFYTGIWYTIVKAATKISVVVNVRNITRVTDLCHLIIVTLQNTLWAKNSDIGHSLHRYGLNFMDLTWLCGNSADLNWLPKDQNQSNYSTSHKKHRELRESKRIITGLRENVREKVVISFDFVFYW